MIDFLVISQPGGKTGCGFPIARKHRRWREEPSPVFTGRQYYPCPFELRDLSRGRCSWPGVGSTGDRESRPRRRNSDRAANPGAVSSRITGGRRHAGKTIRDRKSTRLNSSHVEISYAVFCLKKK